MQNITGGKAEITFTLEVTNPGEETKTVELVGTITDNIDDQEKEDVSNS